MLLQKAQITEYYTQDIIPDLSKCRLLHHNAFKAVIQIQRLFRCHTSMGNCHHSLLILDKLDPFIFNYAYKNYEQHYFKALSYDTFRISPKVPVLLVAVLKQSNSCLREY